MNNHIYFSLQSLPKPHFGGLNRHFKPNMRKIQIAISSDLCIRLRWNLTGSYGQPQRLRGWSRMVVKLFQDGGRLLFWKSIYRHISAKNHQIFMKFCTQQQTFNWMNVTWSKMKKLHWTDSEFDRTYILLFRTFTPLARRGLIAWWRKRIVERCSYVLACIKTHRCYVAALLCSGVFTQWPIHSRYLAAVRY